MMRGYPRHLFFGKENMHEKKRYYQRKGVGIWSKPLTIGARFRTASPAKGARFRTGLSKFVFASKMPSCLVHSSVQTTFSFWKRKARAKEKYYVEEQSSSTHRKTFSLSNVKKGLKFRPPA